MLAMFGIGPMELMILGGLCCGGLGLVGIVVGIIVFVVRREVRQRPLDDRTDTFAENQAPSGETRRTPNDQAY